MPLRLSAVYNPISGRGAGARLAEELAARLRSRGHVCDFRATRRAGDAGALAAAAARDPLDALVVIGGDGTLNEVVNGLAGAPVAVCPVPMGTANVLASELHLPRDPAGVVASLEGGGRYAMDLGVCNGRRFFLMIGAGFDGEVVTAFHRGRKGAIRKSDYFLAATRFLARYRAPRIRITVDGRAVTERATWVLVSNVAGYAAFFSFARDARADDGALDVVWFTGGAPRDIYRYFWAGLRRQVDRLVDARWVRGAAVRLDSPGPVAKQMDGDPNGALPAEISMLPKALTLVVPG
ncbi:MAG: diacylglycerol kinase family lipid kinase [Planctomycetes bacterium]|nr:diacylglycerol kinase family lipid kinase [Planctomycetota bacterium]